MVSFAKLDSMNDLFRPPCVCLLTAPVLIALLKSVLPHGVGGPFRSRGGGSKFGALVGIFEAAQGGTRVQIGAIVLTTAQLFKNISALIDYLLMDPRNGF